MSESPPPAGHPVAAPGEPLIELRHIGRSFPGVIKLASNETTQSPTPITTMMLAICLPVMAPTFHEMPKPRTPPHYPPSPAKFGC